MKKILNKVYNSNIPQLTLIQIVEKLFPLISLFIVSKLYNLKTFDSYGLAIVYVSTAVTWSTSGIGIAATKATLKNDYNEMNSLNTLSRLFSFLTIIIFFFISYNNNNNTNIIRFLLVGFASYFAAISILKKSISITLYKWKDLFVAYLCSLIFSISTIILLSIYKNEYPEIGMIVFYFTLSVLLNKGKKINLNLKINSLKYFYKELGPLYITGILSGSMVYILTTLAISTNKKEGLIGLIAVGFQLITILQFIPMVINRLLFISLNEGVKINIKKEIITLFTITFITAIPLYIILPYLGKEYLQLSKSIYLYLFTASFASTISTFYGSILVAKEKIYIWTFITLISSIIGVLTMLYCFSETTLHQIFLSITVTYIIQFLLGFLYYEKYRTLYFQ